MGIFEDARNGTLDEPKLDQYKTLSFDIDALDPKTGLTLLATASLRGRANVVRLLIQNNASATKLSRGDCTPAWFAAAGSMKTSDRAEILRLLHAHGVDIDRPSPRNRNYTPLMKVVVEWEDPAIVRQLVGLGADVAAENSDRETASTLAAKTKNRVVIRALDGNSPRRKNFTDFVLMVVIFILHVIVSVGAVASGVVQGVVESRYQHDNIRSASRSRELQESKTIEEYSADLVKFIADNNLGNFFKKGDPFLKTLVHKAAKIKSDPKSTFKTDKDIRDLLKLSLYQQVIFCDDSTSMSIGNRLKAQRRIVKRIAKVATSLAPDGDGVELRFINSSVSGSGLRDAEIEAIVAGVRPAGDTAIGTNLIAKILKPLVYDKLASQELKGPVLVSIITDGCPDPEAPDMLRDAIRECGKKLVEAGYGSDVVLFQISRIGNSRASKEFFDGLRNDEQLQRVLYCTTDRLEKVCEEVSENENENENEDQLDEWVYVTVVPPDELSVVV
ncbi:ankyrin [Daldinia caldariorum]|uniref:ankyrin n=1 Tax=Daldinia caldariorum TaxID=326644 RepID=UPI0020077318|nr:ankyrin [Daldinia caldariorum]KAI1465844.1 ankyrin [Daldinia caldariorum]